MSSGTEGDRPLRRRRRGWRGRAASCAPSRGKRAASMNCNSVRKRPIDCAPVSARCGMSTSSPAFICRPIATPSTVVVGVSRRARYCAWPASAHARLFGISRFDVRRWAQMDFARVSVDDDRVAMLDDFRDIRDIAHGGDREARGRRWRYGSRPASSSTTPRSWARS